MFKSLGLIIQHLVKLITPDLPQFLRHSHRLRYHAAPHVRQLAAATLSYLIRHATNLQMRAALRTVFAGTVQCTQHLTLPERTDVCSSLVGYVRNALHGGIAFVFFDLLDLSCHMAQQMFSSDSQSDES